MARKLTTAEWKAAAWAVNKSKAIDDQSRLAFFKELRSLDVLPEEATFFLIEWEVVLIYEPRYERDREVRKLLNAMWDIENQHGMDEGWAPGEGPKKYQVLCRKYEDRKDQIRVRVFREIGEPGMADLYLTDKKRFKELSCAGHEYFYRDFDFDFSVEGLTKRGFPPNQRVRKAA